MCVCISEDYPSGTWLGDENNPEMRVRCPITPADMLHISTNCRTAEKMALTLLDYLFHREIQAISNLSGQGKHGKKQLDPLMIYGIRCEYLQPLRRSNCLPLAPISALYWNGRERQWLRKPTTWQHTEMKIISSPLIVTVRHDTYLI